MIKSKLWAKILLILTTIYLMPTYVGAEPGFWDKMDEQINNEGAQNSAWKFVSGPMALFSSIIIIIGLGILLLAVIFIAINAGKGFLGKGGVTKPVIKVFVIGVVIGILCTSGGWLGLFKATQQLAVEPATEIITNQEDKGTEKQDTQKPTKEQGNKQE
ncbi:MAG: hypothetical protein BWY74_00057 [Firmicutes bacterium ADurb.Bin419]|nr:MAG: hypothetical protein BWY74_00057 [Firmicutes bacterium ADurb.Bin419]